MHTDKGGYSYLLEPWWWACMLTREIQLHRVAIRATGDGGAEVIKTAAFDEHRNTNDEEALVVVAPTALSMVMDATKVVSLVKLREKLCIQCLVILGEYVGALSMLIDATKVISLVKLREKLCIQCLVILGEYVEVLGHVLRENGFESLL